MQPVIKQLADGRYACEYRNADGSVTNFTGTTYEDLIGKLAAAHSNVTDALARSRKQSVEQLQKAREAQSAANTEKIILSWLRNASTEFGGEYFCCAANNDILIGWLSQRQLPITSDNLTMAFRDLQQSNSLAQAPRPVHAETVEEPLPPTPPGYPEVSTAAEVRALQNLRGWLDPTQHIPQAIAAFKLRINAILARSDVRRQRVAAGSLAGGR